MNNKPLDELSDRLLEIIRKRKNHFHTLKYLSKKLNQNEKEILEAVSLLKENGYIFRDNDNKEFSLSQIPDRLIKAEILNHLKTNRIGKNIHAYRTIQSTNIIAAQLAQSNVPEGTIVVAEEQTRGRGRFGRNWFSAMGRGIYCSIILYPKISPAQAPGISLMTAVSLADTMASFKSLNVKIKWPNDCLLNGRKTAGILTELSAEIGHIHYVVVGIGINVNYAREDFPEDIAKRATSIKAETGIEISRVKLLADFLKNFEKDYGNFNKTGLTKIRNRIIKYSSIIGNIISLKQKDNYITGKAIDIDDDGHLVMELAGGIQKVFNAGEVTIIKTMI